MIEIRHLCVRYAGRSEPTLTDICLSVGAGELALLCGPTGCGKSTLLHCLNGILLHESGAEVQGEILLDGRDIRRMPLKEICRVAGSVFQNPDSQICAATVESEVAFGLENMALPRAEMLARIAEALEAVGLAGQREHATGTLSGGQKQRLAIACALALRPRVLLLDEPVSQVDSESAAAILEMIVRLKEARDLAVLLIEHRLDETARLADRILLMNEGRLWLDQPRADALENLEPLRSAGIALPHLPDLFSRLGRKERPLSAEAAPMLAVREDAAAHSGETAGAASGEVICTVRDLSFRYSRQSPMTLEQLNLVFRKGERVALMGGNGSGKTTLLHLLAGLLKPTSGVVQWTADAADSRAFSAGLVLQHPDLMLFQETVRDEIAFAPLQQRLESGEREIVCRDILERLGLTALADEAPFGLSRGQRVRTAVGSVLSMRPRFLLLDEPTAGQDQEQIERMMDTLGRASFDLVIFCTHDVDTAARHGNRVLALGEKGVLLDGSPREVLFDRETLARAHIRPTGAQSYAFRLGVRSLTVEELAVLLSDAGG